MKRLRKTKPGKVPRLCRQLSKPATRTKQKLASQLRDAQEGTTRTVRPRHLKITSPLDQILLSLGYEASMVSLLGRKYGR